MKDIDFMVTLWPTFKHFKKYTNDKRLSGIRLNSAMVNVDDIGDQLQVAKDFGGDVPLYFDIKGNQLRVVENFDYDDHLELEVNHPIDVKTPTPVILKAGEDVAILKEIKDQTRLIFEGGPRYLVSPGESLQIRDTSLRVYGPTFLEHEIAKIERAKAAGFNRFFLSYVRSQKDLDEFREYVGDSEVVLKIEDNKGLEFVANHYKKQDNTWLLAARGDLFVEVDRPHNIIEAMKLIIEKDPDAGVGSRILLSLIQNEYRVKRDGKGQVIYNQHNEPMMSKHAILNPTPRRAYLADIALLYELGYRKMMLCDELCLQDDLLSAAITHFQNFVQNYDNREEYILGDDYKTGVASELLSSLVREEVKKDSNGRVVLGPNGALQMENVPHDIPCCADFSYLEWLFSKGYNQFSLHDELYSNREMLQTASNVLDEFSHDYYPGSSYIISPRPVYSREKTTREVPDCKKVDLGRLSKTQKGLYQAQ